MQMIIDVLTIKSIELGADNASELGAGDGTELGVGDGTSEGAMLGIAFGQHDGTMLMMIHLMAASYLVQMIIDA